MINIEKVDLTSKEQVNAFVHFQYDLYKDNPQFCPPFFNDIKLMLNKQKHPFYEHSDGEFFIAKQDGKIVGRLGALVNDSFNDYHKVKKGQFYLFDSVDDQDIANKLFDRAFDWCRSKGLNDIVGPKGLSAFDGYGLLVEGYEHHQMMTMMNYNFPYYRKLIETIGFEKEVDFVSCYLHQDHFSVPEKVREVARRVKERGKFVVHNFKNKREMVRDWADRIGDVYNNTFVNNWEYYPLTSGEVKLLVDNLMVVADPRLIKIITYDEKLVGFLLAFPDITPALKRHNGRVTPLGIIDMAIELKKTKWVSLNGAGVLPEYQGRGGNALMYYEMEKTIKDYGFIHGELTQVAETAVQMRKDLISVGGQPYKNHRVYHKKI
jgi:GNAT superfamily N-acetyltransferase